MNDTEKLVLALGIGASLWFLFGTAAALPSPVNDAAPGLPWYLNYNTTPAIDTYVMNALPQQAVGIQNTSDKPCSTCSMFGAGFGSQY